MATTKPQTPAACRRALEKHLEPDFFQALCDPVRVSLVAHLAASARPLTVTEVSHCCGVHLSGVSRHLALLERAGLVTRTKQGRERLYELEAQRLTTTLRALADCIEDCWDQGAKAAAG